MSLVRRLLLVVLALVAWEAVARSGAVSPIICPSLAAIAHELMLFVSQNDRLVEAWYSLYRALSGFALAVVVGVPLGAVIGRVRWLERIFDPVFSSTYPIPKIAFYPILVLALGIGSLSKVALVFLECLYPIVLNSAAGVRTVDRVLVWSALNMGASRLQVLRKIVLPGAAPAVFAGFRVAMPIALIGIALDAVLAGARRRTIFWEFGDGARIN